MARKTKNLIGIELGEETYKLVSFNPGRREVDLVALTNVDPSWKLTPAALGQAIHSWLQSLGLIKSIGKVAIGLPAQNQVLRLVEVDEGDDAREALAFEMRTWFGRDRSFHRVNLVRMGEGPHQKPGYLLAGATNRQVEWMSEAFQTAKLPLGVLGLDIVAAYNAFEVNYPSWSEGLTAIVKCDGLFLQVFWTEGRKFLGHGVATVPEGPDAADRLAFEAARLVASGEGLLVGDASRCVRAMLCGDRVPENDFAAKMGSGLRVQVALLDAFSSISFPSAQGMQSKLSETAPRCASALGLAVGMAEGDLL